MEDNVLIRRVAVESVSEKYQVDSGYDVIGKECLKNNIKVKQITMPEIRRIGQQAFFSCTTLKNAEFPKVVTVGKEAFANCSNLRRISFPKSLRSLEKGAFYKCKRANSVSFSEDSACREIPDRTFAECRQMKILVLPDALEEIGAEAFYKCEELTRVRLPDTLRKIGKRGFYQCGLEELHLPEHLEYIGESAFLKCKKLEYVRVPESVRMIGKWAFHGCGRLKKLEIHHDPEEVGEWITNKNCTIVCPKGSKMEAYAKSYELNVEYL